MTRGSRAAPWWRWDSPYGEALRLRPDLTVLTTGISNFRRIITLGAGTIIPLSRL